VSSVDADLRLLLTSCTPLLNNRNSSVVLQVATLYYHLAPTAEFSKVGKPLVAVLGTHPEIQYVVLSNISTMAIDRPVCLSLLSLAQSFNQQFIPFLPRDRTLLSPF